ncbi:MAG: hypothetical protein IPG17_06765 [Sandaracinaceae bacterium]|nr:hypothetical protein [Sandaracinaceae bacterium]MBK7152456.1 hypothetical protein [Sandaracinaceae bacterium]MBP7680764.1 hypothetical protein [Deltaproteobacteria bacterium]
MLAAPNRHRRHVGGALFLAFTLAALLREPRAGTAQAPCDRDALLAAAATLTPRDVRVPPHGERSRRCLRVSDGGVVLGTPVAVSLPGAACALAVTFRHTIVRSETCGYDVHYEPLELTGVAILRRSGRRFRTVAAGHFVMRDLGALSANEDGTLMLLHGQQLLLRGGRLALTNEFPLR